MADVYAGVGQGGASASLPAGTDAAAAAVEETPTAQVASESMLTRADVQAIAREIAQSAVTQASQTWDKTLQSRLDKRVSGLEKRLSDSKLQADRVVKSAKENGLDEAAATALGQRLLNEDIAAMLEEANQPPAKNGQRKQDAPAETDDGTEPTNEPQQVAAYQQFITQQGDLLRDAYDMPYDAPEMKAVVVDQGEQAYFDSIKAAGKKYRERTAQAARPARLPGLGAEGGSAPRNPIAHIDNPSELYKIAAKQSAGNPVRR